MKARILIILMFCIGIPFCYSQEFSAGQKKLRSEMMDFLKVEGFMPELDKDGDITFKKEGSSYYIAIDKRDESPLYIAIGSVFAYGEPYTKANVSAALSQVSSTKAVKVVCFENSYAYQAEMYLVNAEHFKYTFYKLMKQLASLKKELAEICDGQTSGTVSSNGGASTEITFENLFPVYGVTIGKTTVQDLKKMGAKVEDKGTYNICFLNDLMFKDIDKNDIFDEVALFLGDPVPENWQRLGIDPEASYNEWKKLLERNNDLIVLVESKPVVENKDGRKFLDATLEVISKTGKWSMIFYFEGGNKNNEGYTVDSKRSLLYFKIKKN